MHRYFHKAGSGFDVAPAVEELERLGITELDEGVGAVVLYQHPGLPGGPSVRNPRYEAAHALLADAVAALGYPTVFAATLRVLPPHGKIPKHRDGLTANTGRRRYHLALQADEQSWFVIRDERCCFRSGELWRVDLLDRPHSVTNNSPRPRVMLMVDTIERSLAEAIGPKAMRGLVAQFGPEWATDGAPNQTPEGTLNHV